MVKISKESNPNYLAKIVEIKDEDWKEHTNADKLKLVNIDFQTVITGIDAPEGVYVYFPVECKINEDFLSFTNSFRDKEKNSDKEKTGFFEDNCRVKALKLRSEKSEGYIVPASEIEEFTGITNLNEHVGEEFDTIGDVKLLEKYVVKRKENNNIKTGKKPKTNRLIDGQVHLHVDTEQLVKNVHKINPDDVISITYKTHGTSWWTGNLMVKKPVNWFENILQKVGVNIVDTEYDLVYGSRKIVKNKNLEDPKAKDHYYGYDLWEDIKNEVSECIPKGYTLYGECLGYTKEGGYIQKDFDYKCPVGKFKLEIYRITVTNSDGFVTELSTPEVREFCEKVGLTPSYLFYHGKAEEFYSENISNLEEWRKGFIELLRKKYNEKNCFRCDNPVPEEGVVVRKEGLFSYNAFKLKSFRFLEKESKELDKGEPDIESEN